MELLLNLFWTLLTLSGGAAFVIARRRSSANVVPARCLTGLLAIGCAAVLLFPVISATDDEHPTQCLVEDAGKRAKVAIAGGNSPIHPPTWLTSAVPLVAWVLFTGRESSFTALAHRATPLATRPRTATAQRGPPLACLAPEA